MPRQSLTIYPAIDLKNGRCVRLRQGEMDSATAYADDPALQAASFQKAGCQYLHVVDLDGAFGGASRNSEAIRRILGAVDMKIQLGGGIRTLESIAAWLELGITRVILGSIAVKNPGLVREACQKFPGRIVAGIDARRGRVATEGWADESELSVTEIALKMQDAGVAAVIFTEITRDGMMSGIDIPQTTALAQQLTIPVIASGGVGALTHLRALQDASITAPNIEGVIIGRALYENCFTMDEARQILGGADA